MKKIISFVVMLTLLMGMSTSVFASDYSDPDKDVQENWNVSFNGEKLISDFKDSQIADSAAGMQPGDQQTFKITLKNDFAESVDWYMENEVISSLEQSVKTAAGGAYEYDLTYEGPGTTEPRILFSSRSVGGDVKDDGREGMREATEGLEDYFYLDTFKKGEIGYVTLVVALDGETQGNGYQDSLAKLRMRFAVELSATPTPTPTGTPTPTTTPKPNRTPAVKTSDDTNKLPYFIGMGASGLVILILAIVLWKKRKDENKEGVA